MTTSHNTPDRPDFISKQYEFAAHIRDPDKHARPADVEDRRMKIYRELFYNNVEGFMSSTYPVLKEILGEARWHELVRDYFSGHLSHTPLFPEMPREFLKYLENGYQPRPGDPPFMLELAHYEWVELGLSVAEQEIDMRGINPDGDLLEGVPVLSSLAWPLAYQFEVQKIGPDFQPTEPGTAPTYLIVYRNHDDEVGFIETNPVTARLVQLINEDTGATGREMLAAIADELDHPDPDVVIQGGLQILQDLRARDVVLGTRAG
ncbi:MAG: putative DNA-binding domain-containing protein [Pseudomonadota bacterium]|nr:MAG: putative DNA-binding domain-containing protein [Pseudomonadota bacterium]